MCSICVKCIEMLASQLYMRVRTPSSILAIVCSVSLKPSAFPTRLPNWEGVGGIVNCYLYFTIVLLMITPCAPPPPPGPYSVHLVTPHPEVAPRPSGTKRRAGSELWVIYGHQTSAVVFPCLSGLNQTRRRLQEWSLTRITFLTDHGACSGRLTRRGNATSTPLKTWRTTAPTSGIRRY